MRRKQARPRRHDTARVHNGGQERLRQNPVDARRLPPHCGLPFETLREVPQMRRAGDSPVPARGDIAQVAARGRGSQPQIACKPRHSRSQKALPRNARRRRHRPRPLHVARPRRDSRPLRFVDSKRRNRRNPRGNVRARGAGGRRLRRPLRHDGRENRRNPAPHSTSAIFPKPP